MKLTDKQLAVAYVQMTEGKSGKALSAAAAQFLAFLAGSNEQHRVRGIIRRIDAVWKERHGAAVITVESAHPLSREARRALEAVAHGAALRDAVVPELIGGARVRIDDRVIDGSLAGRVEQLTKALMV